MPRFPAPLSAHPTDAVRAAEHAAVAAAPAGALMQRAAAALAAVVVGALAQRGERVPGASVVLLVGSGDNGGDALHAGARLAGRGAAVTAILTGSGAHPGGLAALRAAGGRVRRADAPGAEPLDEPPGTESAGTEPPGTADDAARAAVASALVVLDGMLGTGGRPGLRGAAADLASTLEALAGERRPLVVAIDVPSGVDVGSGELPGPCVRADVTVTMGAAKPALLLPPARALAGEVVVVDLGLDAALLGDPAVRTLDAAGAAQAWPVPGPGDDKYSRGVLGVVAGGDTYTGAALLCTGAAVRAGAGMVRFAGAAHPAELIRARWPEVVTGSGRVQAWVAGPGLDLEEGSEEGSEEAARTALRACLEQGIPVLLDSGALPLLVDHVREHGPLDPDRNPALLTPHAGEAVRLLDGVGAASPTREQVESRPLHHASAAARATGTSVLLKGATTIVAEPGGSVWAQDDGPPWLATAGSGDVLAGIAGALLATGLRPGIAGALAACVHGRAARAANPGGPVDASSVHEALPGVVAALLREHGRVGA